MAAEPATWFVVGPGTEKEREATLASIHAAMGADAIVVTVGGATHELPAGASVVVLRAGSRLLIDGLERLLTPLVSGSCIAYGDDELVHRDRSIRRRAPDWSPRLLLARPYFFGRWAFRVPQAIELGGGDAGWESDLFFAALGAVQALPIHVPVAVVRGGELDAFDLDAHTAAANAYLVRRGNGVMVRRNGDRLLVDDVFPTDAPSVSVIIPTRGTTVVGPDGEVVLAAQAISSLLARTMMSNIEFVVVHDRETPAKSITAISAATSTHPLRLIEFDEPFNFSRKCNIGFLHSSGEVLLMLNDDILVTSDRFLERLLAPLADPEVGGTGALLLFDDGTVQHAGHWYSGRSPRHRLIGEECSTDSGGGYLEVDREVSGLTAACMAIDRRTFGAVGGFSEEFPNNYNDADLSHKVRARGLRLIWLHRAVAVHFESKTRDGSVSEWERELLVRRWGDALDDPYWPADLPPLE